MSKKQSPDRDSKLRAEYGTGSEQKCFVGCSRGTPWLSDLFEACGEVLPKFGLRPWYAGFYLPHKLSVEDAHVDTTQTVLKKVVQMIDHAPYGIYDLSYWQESSESEWQMPHNVLIELGMAIAFNRPTFLLRHKKDIEAGLKLPECLAGKPVLEFSGATTLRDLLRQHLEVWKDQPAEQVWDLQEDCVFMEKKRCAYRSIHPLNEQWQGEVLHCLISDGPDADRADFRGVVEEILKPYWDVRSDYLEAWPPAEVYQFLLCTICQAARSTQFAIHRITPYTLPETFITIGISAALEEQFGYEIPRIRVAKELKDIPSLLYGYESLLAQSDWDARAKMQRYVSETTEQVRSQIHEIASKADNVLAEAEQALIVGEPIRAIATLELAAQRYPEFEPIEKALHDARAAQQQGQEEIESLLQEAEALMSNLTFSGALQKYEAVLELDENNEAALSGRARSQQNAELLQKIDAAIRQAHIELDRRQWRNAHSFYRDASRLDIRGWRKTELERLKGTLDKAERSWRERLVTYDTMLKEGGVRWPDEMEEIAEEIRHSSVDLEEFEILAQIEKFQNLFLQQHFNFLSTELSDIEKLALTGALEDLKECITRLGQIKQYWEPILSDEVRLSDWPSGAPLFKHVESRVQEAFGRLDVYGPAARQAKSLDEMIQSAQRVLSKPDGHYEAAIQAIQQHLDESLPEDDPAYDILRSRYTSLKRLKMDLQRTWHAQRSRKVVYLNQAKGFILLEEYEQAQAALSQVSPGDLLPDDQKLWGELNQAVLLGVTVTHWMQKADEAWDTGDWETAQINYQSIVENLNISQENRYRQKAASRLQSLEKVRSQDEQIQNALAKPAYSQEEVKEIDEILSRVRTLLQTSGYLQRQAAELQQRLDVWYHRARLRDQVEAALSQGDWEKVNEIMKEIESDLDPETTKLQRKIENVKQAPDQLLLARRYVELADAADDVKEATRLRRKALAIFKSVDKLNLDNDLGYEARAMVEDLTEEIGRSETGSTL